MTTERRTDARGKAAARVTFTDAASDTPHEGKLHDIGRGGMFVETASPVQVGKRLDFEVTLDTGSTIVGMARVVWVREAASGELAPGMGIKFIDVDNDALLAIDRLVGLKKNVRERTVLGLVAPKIDEPNAAPPKVVEEPKVDAPKVEADQPEPKPDAPKPEAPKASPPRPVSRERTVLGIAPPAAREEELSWPDEPPEPAKEPIAAAPEPEPKPEPEPEPKPEPEPAPKVEAEAKLDVPVAPISVPRLQPDVIAAAAEAPISSRALPTPRELPKRGSGAGMWLFVVVVVVGLGVAAYMFRDQFFPGTPAPVPSASASAAPPVSASASVTPPPPSAEPSATAAESDAAAVLEATPDAATEAVQVPGTGPRDAGRDAARHHGHDGGAPHRPKPKPTASAGGDNPY